MAFRQLRRRCPNPVDLVASAGANDYERALEAILADPGVDVALVIFTPPLVTRADEVSAAILAAAGRHPGKPVLSTLLTASSSPTTLVGPGGHPRVPAFGFPEQAIRALGHVARYARWLARPPGRVPTLEGFDLEAARAAIDESLEGADTQGPLAPGRRDRPGPRGGRHPPGDDAGGHRRRAGRTGGQGDRVLGSAQGRLA